MTHTDLDTIPADVYADALRELGDTSGLLPIEEYEAVVALLEERADFEAWVAGHEKAMPEYDDAPETIPAKVA